MVRIWLKETSQPLVYNNVINTYQKGDFYCIYDGEKVYKIPIQNIFKLEEVYDFKK